MIVLTRRATHCKSQNSRKQTASTKRWVEAMKKKEDWSSHFTSNTFDPDTKEALSTLFFSSSLFLLASPLMPHRTKKKKNTNRNPWEEKLCVKEKVDRNQIKRDCLLVKANTVSPWKFRENRERALVFCVCIAKTFLSSLFAFFSVWFFCCCWRSTKNNPLEPNETLTFCRVHMNVVCVRLAWLSIYFQSRNQFSPDRHSKLNRTHSNSDNNRRKRRKKNTHLISFLYCDFQKLFSCWNR